MAAVKSLLDGLVTSGALRPDDLIGCSPEEIEQVRLDQRVSCLPDEYVCFLRLAGRGAGELLRGSDAFYPQLLGIKSDVGALLTDSGAEVALGAESLVIGMHQGYQAFWIPCITATEPEVVMFQEGDPDIRQKWDGIASYLDDMAASIK
jgi:hypothetical protein